MTASGVVRVDRPAAHVARVLINRPDKRNAIDLAVRQALIDALTAALATNDNRAIVLGGVGGVFSAGGDVDSMVGLDEEGARERMRHVHVLCRLVAGIGIPVVTAMEGYGAGGGVGLALLGDWVVVGEETRILFPFLKLGLAPDWGLLRSLPMRVGLPAARRLLLDGRAVAGNEAAAIGLADQFVGKEDVMAAAVAKADILSRLPAPAFARMKARLARSSSNLDDELVREESDQVALLQGADFVEGIGALRDKRVPNFVR